MRILPSQKYAKYQRPRLERDRGFRWPVSKSLVGTWHTVQSTEGMVKVQQCSTWFLDSRPEVALRGWFGAEECSTNYEGDKNRKCKGRWGWRDPRSRVEGRRDANKAFAAESHILKLDARGHIRQSCSTREAQATKRLKIRLRSGVGVFLLCNK